MHVNSEGAPHKPQCLKVTETYSIFLNISSLAILTQGILCRAVHCADSICETNTQHLLCERYISRFRICEPFVRSKYSKFYIHKYIRNLSTCIEKIIRMPMVP